MRESEEKFRLIFDFNPDAVALNCLSDGLYVDINAGFSRITGYSRDDLIGKTSMALAIWYDLEDRQRLTKALLNQGYIENLEAQFRKKNGGLITALMSAAIINLRGVPHLISITRDITDRKKLEAQLIQAQKMEAIGTLAGGIAHDFNNILGAIMGYTEIVQEDVGKNSGTAANLAQILKAGNRAKDLVNQILTFSRQTEEKKLPLQPILLVRESIKLLRSSMPTTIVMNQDLDPESGFILADPTQLHQIIMNLCTNAFHAMEEHGGTLSVSLNKKLITGKETTESATVQPGSYVQISIGDTGAGIPPEIQERIFEPYFTTKEQGKGTGLGLSITHGIVKSYRGFIECRSQYGKGSTFNIYLPSWAEEVLPEIHPPATRSLQASERILLVDDEQMLGEMYKVMLERSGYTVTLHTDSQEAYTAFKNQSDQFDVVITDQTMPGMTGFELAKKMLHIRPDIPIILCTGYNSFIAEEKARIAGIKGFLQKPFSKKDTIALIRKILQR